MSRVRCRGLNIFEFVAILLIVGGLSYGFTRGLDAGPWEATVGALKWGGIAWVVFAALMLCVLVPLRLFLLYRPFYPRCSSGRCKDRDYRPLGEDEMAELRAALRDRQALLVRCRCGAVYCSLLNEQRFYEVTPTGELRPYLRYRAYRRWEPDTG
jgi:hypothetical protein